MGGGVPGKPPSSDFADWMDGEWREATIAAEQGAPSIPLFSGFDEEDISPSGTRPPSNVITRGSLFSDISVTSNNHFYTSPFYIDGRLPPPNTTFQLMEIISDKRDLSFVDKVLVSEGQISALCNAVVAGSARVQDGKLTNLDFNYLDAECMNVVGFYGDKAIMAKIFRKGGLAPIELLDSMDADQLKPGLYACLNNGKVYLFYWDGKKQMADASRKDVSCNFVRYLVELCEIVYVCVEGKNAEKSITQSQRSLPTRSQRMQRLQISMRKESEDDLKLVKGFSVELPAVCHGKLLGIQLSQGLHRCVVLACALNPRKLVSRVDYQADTVDKLKTLLASKFANFSVDCTDLPEADFLLLLEMLGEQEQLTMYRKAEEERKQRQVEMNKKLQSRDSILKKKETEISDAFQRALGSYLLSKNPWEESLLDTAASKEKSCKGRDEEKTHASPSLAQALLELECDLCGIWNGQHSPDDRFLFTGVEVEVASKQGIGASAPGLFLIKVASDSSKAAAGPICFGQEVMLIEQSNRSDHTQEKVENRAYFSKIDSEVCGKEPVIVNEETTLRIETIENKNSSQLVHVRRLDDGGSGMKNWLDAICDGKPLCLYQKAAAASFIIGKMDSKVLDDKLVEKLLKEESFKEWNSILPKQASSLLVEFLSEHIKDEATFIHNQAATNSARIYREARQELCMAIQALVRKKISPILREKLHKCLKQESEAIKVVLDNEKRDLLSTMKMQMFAASNSTAKREHEYKLCLTRVEYFYSNTVRHLLGSTKLKIRYSFEELERETMTWKAVEMVPDRGDLEELMSAPSSDRVVVPRCASPEDLLTLDPSVESLARLVLMKSGQALVFVEAKDKSYLRMYHCPRLGVSMVGRNPLREFQRGFDLVAFDEASRFMAMYNKTLCFIRAFRFDESFQHMDWTGVDIQLSQFSGSSNIVWMEFVPGKRELLIADDQNRLRVCELAAAMMKPRHITLSSPFIKACVTPDSSCLIVFTAESHPSTSTQDDKEENIDRDAVEINGFPISPKFSFSVSVYLLGDSLALLKCFPLDSIGLKDLEELHAECKYFGPQMHLVFISAKNNNAVLMSHVLQISSAQQTFQLQKVGTKQFSDHLKELHPTDQNPQSSTPALDYIFHVFDKYATSPPLCSAGRSVQFCVLLSPPPHQKWDSTAAEKKCEAHIHSSLLQLEEKGKAFTKLHLHASVESLEDCWCLEKSMLKYESSTSTSLLNMKGWIQKMLCLVPLQIARAENNTLKPLINGLQIPADAAYSDAVSLASLLRFGLYDLVLANWKGDVKVISSMGKQSSGKSYLLNHLAGCLLDVAGGRCTDGVWMTVRREPDCLYVLLDFEGLGSFERSDQEDMFLSILNAAISNVTIFNKKDFHLDKETEAIFQRFQDGISLVKADDKLFKGLFYMAIKDVDASDVEDLKSEFFAKINHICSKSNENFLTTMYGGEVEIAALPPFQRPEFQESIADIGSAIKETKASYQSGRRFMDDLKLVIAQISTRDWSPVDSKRLVMRLSLLRKHLKSAIRLGQCFDSHYLLDFDKQEEIKDDPVCIGEYVFAVKDAGLELADENKVMGTTLMPLRQAFECVVERQGNDEKWYTMYEGFLASLIDRRKDRVLTWLQVNTHDFQEDGDVQKLTLEAIARLAEVKSKLVLCACRCKKCFLRCILEKGHPSDHSCLGSHVCMHQCTYCKEKEDFYGLVLDCNDLAGHDGAHDCKQRTHTCGRPCVFSRKSSNCNSKCSLRVDHEGDHRCNSLQHMCNQRCSLPHCRNACVVPFELGDHERHACHEKFCPKQCSMEGCTRTCVTQDHFHQLEAGAEHFCANEHSCGMKCESPGICNVLTELLKQTRSFHGKRSDFEYEYVSEQTEDRKDCCLMIPPFKWCHIGPHTHSTNANVVHYCETRCPACDYYCQLPMGHAGLHKTVHGNMRKMKFVSEVEEIDVLDRRYARGESGMAEMCMMHCKARGRGHTHLVPCPEKGGAGCCTGKLFDGARHEKTKCSGLDVDVPLDEMTHDAYWEYARFVDPCEEAERESFALCDHYCRSDEHLQGQSGKSYCTEKLWHAPVSKGGPFQMGSGGGYVTEDGHHFTCNHSKDSPHNVVFVIDKSGSMETSDISPSMAKFIQSGHTNRLGCVYEAVLRFIKTRMQATNGQVEDSVSVVLFDNGSCTPAQLEKISEQLVDKLLVYTASGGTTYSSGLQAAEQILCESSKQPELDKKSPVVIFLSDGGNNGGADPLYMVQKMKQQEPRLVLHTIMFGHDPYAWVLEKMAGAGDGTFQLSLDEVQLARSFEGLAKSLKPKLAALCTTSSI